MLSSERARITGLIAGGIAAVSLLSCFMQGRSEQEGRSQDGSTTAQAPPPAPPPAQQPPRGQQPPPQSPAAATPKSQSYMPVVDRESFDAVRERMVAAKPDVIARHQRLLEERYDLSDRPAQG